MIATYVFVAFITMIAPTPTSITIVPMVTYPTLVACRAGANAKIAQLSATADPAAPQKYAFNCAKFQVSP